MSTAKWQNIAGSKNFFNQVDIPWGHVLLSFLFLIKYVRNPFQMLLNAIVNPKISASGKKAIKKKIKIKKIRPSDIIIN